MVNMKISVLCSSTSHPVYPHLENWAKVAGTEHEVDLVEKKAELSGGDILFLISCHEIISLQDRERYGHTLVIHSSDLPEGRGWSPQIWQILEGKNDIVVSLIEAHDKVDAGPVWAQRHLILEGHELHDEINNKLFAVWLELMDYAVANVGSSTPVPQDDRVPTYFRRRTPEDSRLDPDQSIAAQFELLRVSDPSRFPAFFDLRGHRYFLLISKKPGMPDA
jgi:methionyl-tRNA formyltransferase